MEPNEADKPVEAVSFCRCRADRRLKSIQSWLKPRGLISEVFAQGIATIKHAPRGLISEVFAQGIATTKHAKFFNSFTPDLGEFIAPDESYLIGI